MSIISYAQNFEDVMLWRALGHIEHGFYIDIGAQDPVIDSVSLAFHEHGWNGIHVEPTPRYAEMLRQNRPGDIVIQAAVGEGPSVLSFFEIPGSGISTADLNIANQHRERGFDIQEITVPCIALSDVFDSCNGREIHWLKIDVEGYEKKVLSSWGFATARPWIAIIESTLPLTQVESHETWEDLVIRQGYHFVYFDGLNRYYVSNDHAELNAAFSYPPNVFDGFFLNGTASAPFHKLIENRHQENINKLLDQATQEKISEEHEIERIVDNIESLDMPQNGNAKYNKKSLIDLLQHQFAHQAEMANQLMMSQKKLSKEIADLSENHSEQARNLQSHHVEHEKMLVQQWNNNNQERVQRERVLIEKVDQAKHALENTLRLHSARESALTQQLFSEKQALLLLQQGSKQRERAHLSQINQVRKELEIILREQIEREQKIAFQLNTLQQEKIRQALEYSEQTNALRLQHNVQEASLRELLQYKNEDIQRIQTIFSQHKQNMLKEIREIENLAARKVNDIILKHEEKERNLKIEFNEERQFWVRKFEEEQEALKKLRLDSTEFETSLNKDISVLQEHIYCLQREKQLLTQKHNLELCKNIEDHKKIITTFTVLEEKLRTEFWEEQQVNKKILNLLTEAQQNLASMQASLSWRITAPIRALKSFVSRLNSFHHENSSSNDVFNLNAVELKAATPFLKTAMAEPQSSADSKVPGVSPSETPPVSTPTSEADSDLNSVEKPPIESKIPFSISLTMHSSACPSKISGLLEFHDHEFVQHAYLALLGRESDTEGLNHYVNRLRTGTSKIQILEQLNSSKEGKKYASKLPGLDAALRRHKISNYPLLGFFFRKIYGIEGNHPVDRKLRAIENQIHVYGEESSRRLSQMEASVANLHQIILQQTKMLSDSVYRTQPNAGASTGTSESDEFKQLSPKAKNIYFKLKKAASINAGRAA